MTKEIELKDIKINPKLLKNTRRIARNAKYYDKKKEEKRVTYKIMKDTGIALKQDIRELLKTIAKEKILEVTDNFNIPGTAYQITYIICKTKQ